MAQHPAGFVDAVLAVVGDIPPGHVMTYGDVAAVLGSRAARAVGQVMARYGHAVPWWRVVTSNGRLVPGHETTQAQRLRAEGVRIAAGRVVEAPLGRFSRPETPWTPERRSPARPRRP